jgi:uncharacterized membrane protein YuzA (DUF378 family)
MKNHHILDLVVIILLLAGGLNLGLYGLFKLDIISAILGAMIARIVFVFIGAAAVYRIVLWARSKRTK